jgi:WD40 repeat protein
LLLQTIELKQRIFRLLILDDVNLVLAGASPTISIWNYKDKKDQKQLIGHQKSVRALVKLDENSGLIVSGSSDANIKIWNCTNGRLIKNLTGHSGAVNDLVSLSSRQMVISCSEDKTINIWNTTNGKVLRTFSGQKGAVAYSLSIFDKNLLVSGDGLFVRFWNLDSGVNTQTWNENKAVKFIYFLQNGHLAICDESASIKIRNVTTGFLVRSLVGHKLQVVYLIQLETYYLASASHDGSIKIWNHKSGTLIKTLNSHFSMVNCLGFNKTKILLSASADRTLKVWNLTNIFRNDTINQLTTNIELEYGKCVI